MSSAKAKLSGANQPFVFKNISDEEAEDLDREKLIELWPFLKDKKELADEIVKAWRKCTDDDPVMCFFFIKERVHAALGIGGRGPAAAIVAKGGTDLISVDNLRDDILGRTTVQPPPGLSNDTLRVGFCLNMNTAQCALLVQSIAGEYGNGNAALFAGAGASYGTVMVSSGKGFQQILHPNGFVG